MTDPVSEQVSQNRWTPNANDRMKAQWRAWVARSSLIAVLLHAIVFSVTPTWERAASESNPLQDFLQLEWVSVLQGGAPENADPAPAAQIGALPDSIPEEPELLAAISGTGPEIATLSEAFRERLVGRAAPTPTLAEPEPARDVVESVASEGGEDENGSIDVNGSVAAAEFAELLGSAPIDLDRLSAVRPELVLAAPSAWVLIRNPMEVEQFIRRSYRRGDLERGDDGAVSVALWIDARGSVEWAEISRSSGRPQLDQIALSLFSEVAAFRPARDQGVAVPRSVIFSVRFPW